MDIKFSKDRSTNKYDVENRVHKLEEAVERLSLNVKYLESIETFKKLCGRLEAIGNPNKFELRKDCTVEHVFYVMSPRSRYTMEQFEHMVNRAVAEHHETACNGESK